MCVDLVNRCWLDDYAIRTCEEKLLRFGPLYRESTLVNQPMMGATKLYQIVEPGLTTVRPVFDVVTIDKVAMRTTRELAPSVSRPERPPYRRGNGA